MEVSTRMSMNPRMLRHNIKTLPKASEILRMKEHNFGRYIDVSKDISDWMEQPNIKKTYVSKKRQTVANALKEFKELYNVKEFYASFGKYDDSFEVLYTTY